MVSMTMIPCDVVRAHAEYSVIPTKYRLSNTFAGSACHCDAGGGPACRPPPPVLAAGGCPAETCVAGEVGIADSHTRCCNALNCVRAAAFDAATWLSRVPAIFCAAGPAAANTTAAHVAAATFFMRPTS